MKKIICVVLTTIASFANAQSILPKSATEIAPLLIGEKIPDIILKSSDNIAVPIKSLLKKKKTVLVFYRGGWCPYCNMHLSALAEAEEQILGLGYQIIAISPDAPENLKLTEEKDKIKYTLLSDSRGELAKAVGISFEAPENYKSIINVNSKGENKEFLPVPSIFVLNTDSEIEFEFITPDFKHRITTELLIAVLKTLK
nr:peroxiredoxin-like family protein [uncultured Flavobacterium sp.]